MTKGSVGSACGAFVVGLRGTTADSCGDADAAYSSFAYLPARAPLWLCPELGGQSLLW